MIRPLRRALCAVVVLAAASALAPMAPAGAWPIPRVEGELTVVEELPLSERLREVVVDSPAVGGRTRLRILLPAGFDEQPDRRWPVLYLLHGGQDSYRSWTDKGDAEAITEGLDLIVVMPDSGTAATYTDWFRGGRGGTPAYETHHLVEIRELLESRYRADGRYVAAGLSSGGYGAMKYAALHPDLFLAAASFSGNLDMLEGDSLVWGYAGVLLTGLSSDLQLFATWGDPILHEVFWRGENPYDLAPNLRGMPLYLASGDGRRGPYDTWGLPGLALDVIEAGTHRRTQAFSRRLTALGIEHELDLYGAGGHQWPYWQRELREALPMLMAALEAGPRPTPEAFTHRSARERFAVWGWTFEVTDRRGLAFTDVAIDGDTVAATGDGTLVVTTPPRYEPGARYEVAGEEVRADDAGRVTFAIALGGTAERYTPLPDPPGPRPAGPAATATIERIR